MDVSQKSQKWNTSLTKVISLRSTKCRVNLSPGETPCPVYGNPDSGIRKILISCLWNPESVRFVLAESGILAFGKIGIQLNVSEIPLTILIRNPVPVIRNERRGIQNRRLYMGQDVFGRNDHNYNSYRSFRPQVIASLLTKGACPLMIRLLQTSGADTERSLDMANDSLADISEL